MARAPGPSFRNPHNLPVKVCAACGRPFTWRKRWAAVWGEVRYCSDRCRRARSASPQDARPDSA